MNFIVHLLEVITLVLIGLLFVRLSHCYRAFSRAACLDDISSVSSVHSVRVVINIPASVEQDAKRDAFGSEKASHETLPVSVASEESVVENFSNEQVLNDYIGGFFPEPLVNHQDTSIKASELGLSVPGNAPLTHADSTEEESDEIIVVDESYKITPVILKDHGHVVGEPVVTEVAAEQDEDSVITVIGSNDSTKPGNNIMSDKVVHAMLDEAHVVCPS